MPHTQLTAPLVDQRGRFGYVQALAWIYENFRALASAEDVLRGLGAWLKDISDSREVRIVRATSPVPPGFEEHWFDCPDPFGQSAQLELTWRGPQLVNVRAMLQFWAPLSFLARATARRYFRTILLHTVASFPGLRPAGPRITERLIKGAPDVYDRKDVGLYQAGDIVVVVRVVPGLPAVSTYITDEAYL